MAIANLNIASSKHILLALSNLKSGYNTQNAWVNNSNKYVIDSLTGKSTQIDPLPPAETDPLAPFQIDPLIPA